MAAKYLQIANDLQDDIYQGKYSESGYLPTEMDISAKYNVSRQTVRHALSILVHNGMIERKQGSGSRIIQQKRNSQTKTIAVVTTYINDYIFPDILKDIQLILAKHNYAVLVYATQNKVDEERKILKSILQLHVDGLITEGTKTALPSPNLDLYEKFNTLGIPIVFLHGYYPSLKNIVSITDDNYGGGYQLTKYIINKGHKKIAGIFKEDDIQGHERYNGYISALKDNSIEISDESVFWYNTILRSEFKQSSSEIISNYIDNVLSKCSAVICYNDEIAYYLIKALLAKGYKIPDDIAIASFDNSELSELSPIKITSLAHGSRRIGQKAVEHLIDLIDNKEVKSEIVSWSLIEKESC